VTVNEFSELLYAASNRLATEFTLHLEERLRLICEARGWTPEEAAREGLSLQRDASGSQRIMIGDAPQSGWFRLRIVGTKASIVEGP
jgi:hypothetical protein